MITGSSINNGRIAICWNVWVRQITFFFFENPLKKTYWIFSQIVAYTIGPIFKRIIDCVQLYLDGGPNIFNMTMPYGTQYDLLIDRVDWRADNPKFWCGPPKPFHNFSVNNKVEISITKLHRKTTKDRIENHSNKKSTLISRSCQSENKWSMKIARGTFLVSCQKGFIVSGNQARAFEFLRLLMAIMLKLHQPN